MRNNEKKIKIKIKIKIALAVTQLANYHPHESALRYSLSCTHFDTHDQRLVVVYDSAVGVTLTDDQTPGNMSTLNKPRRIFLLM